MDHKPIDWKFGRHYLSLVKSLFSMMSNRVARNWIAIHGTLLSRNQECIILNIYNPCSIEGRAEVWQEISYYWRNNNYPCIIMGDFNEVLLPDDRGNLLASQTSMSDFQSFIQELQVTEIPSNGRFTWFRGNSKSKLDQIIVSP